jgi:hypothetical protein
MQILDNIPKDQKGKVVMFLSIKREASVMHGKQVLEALVIQASERCLHLWSGIVAHAPLLCSYVPPPCE